MKANIILTLFILIFYRCAFADAVLDNQGGLINLTGDSVTIDPRIQIDINGSMSYENANMPWAGIGPDGIKRNINTLGYSFDGTMVGKISPPTNYCTDQHVWVGWTVVKPNTGVIIHPSSGALYGNGHQPSAAVQSQYMVEGYPSDYEYEFMQQGTIGYIFVTDGPAGMYSGTNIPQVGNANSAYVFSSGDLPIVFGYMDTYGSSCGLFIAGLQNPPIVTPPVIDPGSDLVCDFWFDDDTLNLGVVDQRSAINTSASARLNGLCNADASVNLRASPSEMKMGGLTIRMMFDDYNSNTKLNWDLSEDRTESTSLWAMVTDIGNLIPDSYSRSGVVYIDYN